MARPKREPKSEYQKRLDEGFTPEQARELVMATVRAAPVTPLSTAVDVQPLTAPHRQDRNALGPDPEVVRAQQERARSAAPQPSNVQMILDLEARWFGVVCLYRDILRGQRNLPEMTAEEAMVQLIRWASAAHPDIVLVRTAGKGKAAFVHPDKRA